MTQHSFTPASGSEAITVNTGMSFVSTKRFYDDANFPKGFKRCGDFTSKEAELLELHGQAMKNLVEGKQLACTPDEDQFIQVAQGNIAPSTHFELLWAKYIKLAKGKPFYAVVGTVHAPSAKPVVEVDIEFDDIDDDESSDEESPTD
ncbi:DUF413 domain-containing protein [Shewanella sp. SR44-3]|uniref:DUF413 domain-containing protein n=1 Tax=unclassified Shewanella TaxID=196818 RepID=UPI0015FE0B1D|nr:DUF413 domain-containing protein [Shewanella sp. SR44-3]MBB1269440.1 DUF413 domain-containing protein [Shewanella sp. SR44-3]